MVPAAPPAVGAAVRRSRLIGSPCPAACAGSPEPCDSGPSAACLDWPCRPDWPCIAVHVRRLHASSTPLDFLCTWLMRREPDLPLEATFKFTCESMRCRKR